MALVFIAIAVFIAFRSFKMVLVSLLPNVLPLLFSLAWFGASGQFLDIAPAVAFSIAIGIAVDNNIHIISRYFEELDNHNDYYEAIVKSVVETINPILNTTFILIGGFLILSLSEFTANQMFGYLASAIIFIALLFSFIFAPAALALFKPEKPGATKLIKREDDTVLAFDSHPMGIEDLDENVTTEEINLVTVSN